MTGPTLTVTVSSVESTQSFPSPSSSSPSHPSPRAESSSATHPRASSSSHPPSWSNKSLPDPPAYAVPAIDFDVNFEAEFHPTLAFAPDPPPELPDEKSAGVSIRQSFAGLRPRTESMGKRKSVLLGRPQSWMPTSKSAPDLAYLQHAAAEEMTDSPSSNGSLAPSLVARDEPRSASNSFTSFTRRPWIPASRSPSPNTSNEATQAPEERPGRERAASNTSIMKLRKGSRNRSDSSSSESSRSGESLSKIGSYLNKIKVRPQTARVKGRAPNVLDSSASSTTSLAPPSTETRKSHASETSNSTFPDDAAPARNSLVARDPLWSTFRSLEADFLRFQSKPTPLKMNLIRTSLVPFLRKLGSCLSNLNLHYEDLERRAIILSKWWAGLLEMLHVRTHPPVAGIDRPILLDALTTIMTRPEWRQSTPTFRPLAERHPQERVRRRSQTISNESTSSFHSTDSTYLAESAGHNVRNMFTANLLAQMALVVEKMCLKSAPNSLVNFAGKACAYAFFFAPGVADVLVRLWSLNSNTLRRIADEFKLPRRSNGESDDLIALFPPGMDKLGWTSVTQLCGTLRKPAQPPLASTRIPWTGPWLARWTGRDSDLFFIFCKYYFILAEDFMPKDLPLVEKARAPGFVLVNAQLLSVLDSTLHRQAAVESMSAPFSDALHGADASAIALQAAPSNSNIFRGMAENRLVVLLKNLLSDSSASHGSACHTFAEAFLAVMKAAVKHTSQFDHSACFTICDFLEESLVAYNNYMDSSSQPFDLDWPFWFEVWKKILDSNNSMSEIRVLSLIFSIWETIASEQDQKMSACIDWLLTEETFDKFFNNWCPMVRAYYMRLLCWRICRDAGAANDCDARIFILVFARLKAVWSHYLWLKQHIEQEGKIPPSTAPSFPTPGKRFMIIRTEIPTVPTGFIPEFDCSPSSPRQDMRDFPATDFDSMNNTYNPEVVNTPRKSWSLFGKVFSFSANGDGPNDLEALRRETAASRTSAARPPQLSTGVVSRTSSDTDSIGSSPTFEASQYLFKFILSWNNAGTMPPPNRMLTRPRLPSPAQSWITAKGLGGCPPPMAGRPAPTRAVSGSPLPGLVDSAKNAGSEGPTSPTSPIAPSRGSMALEGRSSIGQFSLTDFHEDDIPLRNATGLNRDNLVSPVEPKGSFASTVKYAGRALAEWSLVVAECNSFVERRREEGILGLQDVEVPALGVEGFRKIC
ncbi:hypothetical protein F4802DRAFT_615574 [Xylaria palmicola]|nr:hypothetical protein F4802DRAFT_615574 [Xylaria palmicola]